MRKGERRKREILDRAKDLFYQKGYENATIQDIIDSAGLSKGGFYHHYSSKDQLLSDICAARAEGCLVAAEKAVEGAGNTAIEKLNAFFTANGLWADENLDFTGLAIKAENGENNFTLRERFKSGFRDNMLPLLTRIIKEGSDHYEFFPKYPREAALLLLALEFCLVDEVSRYLYSCGDEKPNMNPIITLLEVFRNAVERILDAPFGSVMLHHPQDLTDASMKIWERYVWPIFDSGLDPYRPLAVPYTDD